VSITKRLDFLPVTEIDDPEKYIVIDMQVINQGIIAVSYQRRMAFQVLLDNLYESYVGKHVSAYTYGMEWSLVNAETGNLIESPGRTDVRQISEIGIEPGTKMQLILH
jgi:hypothetical protein